MPIYNSPLPTPDEIEKTAFAAFEADGGFRSHSDHSNPNLGPGTPGLVVGEIAAMKMLLMLMVRLTCVLNALHHGVLVGLFLLVSLVFLPYALVAKNHRVTVLYLRFWIRLYYLYNGVWLSVDPAIFSTADIIVTNRDDTVDPILLTVVAPYASIMVVSPQELLSAAPGNRFSYCTLNFVITLLVRWYAGYPKYRIQLLTYLFGFMPEEAFTIFDYKHTVFEVEKYYDSDFTIIQPCYSNRQVQREPIPFSVMLAAKKGVAVQLVRITYSRPMVETSLLCFNHVRIRYHDSVPWQANTVAMMQDYKSRMTAMLALENRT